MSLETSRRLPAPSALPQRNAAPRVIRTSKADEGPASAGDFWAVVRAAALIVLGILAFGYIMG